MDKKVKNFKLGRTQKAYLVQYSNEKNRRMVVSFRRMQY